MLALSFAFRLQPGRYHVREEFLAFNATVALQERLREQLRLEHELGPDRLLFLNQGGKQLEGLVNAQNRCNWSGEATLAAPGGVTTASMGRRSMRSSYLRVDTLYIHLFLKSPCFKLAPGGSSSFGTFIPPRAATFLIRRCTPLQSSRAWTIGPR
jgi:hypothetical protein